MHEYVADAVVLALDPVGEADGRASLFTAQYGKVIARARSVRKITSKLAAHLRPGNRVRVRVVEKNGPLVADVLASDALPLPLSVYAGLDALLPEREPEEGVWAMLTDGSFSWPRALALLGWDPAHAACHACGGAPPAAFRIAGQEFFCASCASALPRNGVIYI